MTWNIAPESISLVMLGIILIYSRKGSRLPTLKNRMFQGCLVVTFCAMLTNILSTVMICFDQIAPLWSTWIITTLYFLLTPLMGLAYFLYTLAIIYIESPGLKKAFAFCSIPGLGYAVLILLNPFTRDSFDYYSGKLQKDRQGDFPDFSFISCTCVSGHFISAGISSNYSFRYRRHMCPSYHIPASAE